MARFEALAHDEHRHLQTLHAWACKGLARSSQERRTLGVEYSDAVEALGPRGFIQHWSEFINTIFPMSPTLGERLMAEREILQVVLYPLQR